jgi:hypothetical protein
MGLGQSINLYRSASFAHLMTRSPLRPRQAPSDASCPLRSVVAPVAATTRYVASASIPTAAGPIPVATPIPVITPAPVTIPIPISVAIAIPVPVPISVSVPVSLPPPALPLPLASTLIPDPTELARNNPVRPAVAAAVLARQASPDILAVPVRSPMHALHIERGRGVRESGRRGNDGGHGTARHECEAEQAYCSERYWKRSHGSPPSGRLSAKLAGWARWASDMRRLSQAWRFSP